MDEMKEKRDLAAKISQEIAQIMRDNEIECYVVGFNMSGGPVVVGVYGNPLALAMINLQLGGDILEALKAMMGIVEGGTSYFTPGEETTKH